MAVNVVLKSVFDDKGIRAAQNEFGKIGKTLGAAFAVVGAATAAAAAGLVKFGADSIAAAENVAQANNRLGQVAKSMGIFGAQTDQVTDRLIKFAEANELTVAVDAEVIKATQAKLLTFKNLAETADEVGGSMDRATMAALDLAAAGFGSAETNAVQLGKALQDPIKGITALARAGVTFTQVEKDKIRALVESGNVLEAQNLILTAIETQVGGTAEATAKASDKIRLAFDNISESVGEALLPVFNEFANELVKITPELEAALAPAAEAVAQIFREQVLPAIRNFTQWLASPQGTKTIKDLAQAVVDGIQGFVNFAGWAIKNKDAIGAFVTAVVIATGVIKTLQLAIQIATTRQLLFNAAVLANPFVASAAAIAIGIGLITTAFVAVSSQQEKVKKDLDTTGETIVRTRGGYVRFAKDVSGASKGLVYSVNQTSAAFDGAEQAARNLNNIKLDKLRAEVARSAGELNRFRNIAAGITKTPAPTIPEPKIPPIGGDGPSPFEQVQKIIKDTQKKLAKAQEDYRKAQTAAQTAYNKATAAATERFNEASIQAEKQKNEALENALKTHNENVRRIQSDFAQRQADIITQSINRLRDAFASAVRTNVADIFGQEEIAGSIDNLITNLRDRLTASRNLVANAAQLASQGFSQTFIEQVVGAGLETGNELSKAILEATPETQRELKDLFGALESESETGMDSLARTMFEKTGLATTELKKLFAQTQTDLAESLKQAQLDYTSSQQSILESFDDAMAAATKARDDAFAQANEQLNESLTTAKDRFVETVNEIKEAFLEQIKAVEGGLGGLKRTVDQLLALLSQLGSAGTPKIGTLPSVPSVPSTPIQTLPIGSQRPTVVNNNTINIKSDATQSPAMVGGAVSKAINKYTRGGGGIAAGVGQVAI